MLTRVTKLIINSFTTRPTKEEGNILLITVPLRTDEDYAANFKAEIENSEEITEVLLMVLTFNPSKLD